MIDSGYDNPFTPPDTIQNASIKALRHRDVSSFNDWINNRDTSQPLDVPQEAIGALVPEKLLELASKPEQVQFITTTQDDEHGHMLEFIVVEREVDQELTNTQSWVKYRQRIAKEKADNDTGIYFLPKRPSDIDSMHWKFRELIESGRLNFNDRILLAVKLRDDPSTPQQLYVSEYEDREDLRGQGLASAFYENLAIRAKSMGYKFLTGLNNAKNLGFFINKLGRVTLDQIKPELKRLFKPDGEFRGGEYFTIQFLDHNDKETYVASE